MLAKAELNRIEVLVFGGLIDLYIIHDKFASVNNVLTVYDGMKEII